MSAAPKQARARKALPGGAGRPAAPAPSDEPLDDGPEVPVAVVAAEVVREKLAAAMLGLNTVSAVRHYRYSGRWIEGKHWHKDPAGTVWIDIPAVQTWVRTGV